MGCCMSPMPPPPIAPNRLHIPSITETTNTNINPTGHPKKYSMKSEPKLSFDPSMYMDKSNSSNNSKCKDEDASYSPDTPRNDFETTDTVRVDSTCSPILTATKSEFQLQMERKKTELLRQKTKLREIQSEAFDAQVLAQQLQNFQGLYDIWVEYAHNDDKTKMDMDGLTQSLKVFGMIINTDRDFQKHIFKKFDVDNEKEITYADFSSTVASFVGSNTHDESLQTLFEIFDIENKGYLEIEDMARILLAQNQITIVVTGQQNNNIKHHIKYTKKQCLKQARRMVALYDSPEFNDNKISFNEFKNMMNSRTENDMILDHMQAPSISHTHNNEQNPIPIFVPNDIDD